MNEFDPIEAAFGQNANSLGMFAPVEISAREADASGEAKPATFEIVAYNGGPLATPAYVQKFGMPVVIDLRGLEQAESITANMDHDQTQRVGHVTEMRNDGRQLVLAGTVSGTGPAATEVVANAKQGYPWQASVEAMPLSPPIDDQIQAPKARAMAM